MSDCTSALLSKTSESVIEVLREQLQAFEALTEISHSIASLELSVKGKLPQLDRCLPQSRLFLGAMHLFNAHLLASLSYCGHTTLSSFRYS